MEGCCFQRGLGRDEGEGGGEESEEGKGECEEGIGEVHRGFRSYDSAQYLQKRFKPH